MPAIPPAPRLQYPVLVTAPWCPFTVPAARLWEEAAHGAGLTLQVLDAESEPGASVISAFGVAGVPCAVAGPGRLHHGYQLSPAGARAFLAGASQPLTPPMP